MKLRLVTLAAIVAAVFGTTSGFAAHLSLTSNTLGSGTTVVARCDPNAATNWTYTFSKNGSGLVNQITVANIGSGCTNGFLSLGTSDSSAGHLSSSSSPTQITSSSVIVTLSTPEYPADLTELTVLVTGP